MTLDVGEREPALLPSALRLLASVATLPLLLGVMGVGLVNLELARRLFRDWTRLQAWIFSIQFEVEDLRPEQHRERPSVYVLLNQTSLVDTLTVPLVLPLSCRAMANIEFILLPFFGWCMGMLKGVMVVRQWPWQRRRAFARAKALLLAGNSFGFAIEGARSQQGLLPYKTGAVRLALAAGAPLVPAIVHGSRERLPMGAWRVRPGRVRVRLYPVLETAGLPESAKDALTAELRALADRELGLATGSAAVRP